MTSLLTEEKQRDRLSHCEALRDLERALEAVSVEDSDYPYQVKSAIDQLLRTNAVQDIIELELARCAVDQAYEPLGTSPTEIVLFDDLGVALRAVVADKSGSSAELLSLSRDTVIGVVNDSEVEYSIFVKCISEPSAPEQLQRGACGILKKGDAVLVLCREQVLDLHPHEQTLFLVATLGTRVPHRASYDRATLRLVARRQASWITQFDEYMLMIAALHGDSSTCEALSGLVRHSDPAIRTRAQNTLVSLSQKAVLK
jgi:hypothetical protein